LSPPAQISPTNGQGNLGTGVDLSWYDDGAIYYYVAYADSAHAYDNDYTYTGNFVGTSYELSGLGQGLTYYWQVFGCDANDSCISSEGWEFEVALPTPIQISPADGEGNLSTSVDVSWYDDGAKYYYVAYADSADAYKHNYTYSGDTSATSYELSGLGKGLTYYWQVFACQSSVWCVSSAQRSFSTAPPTPVAPQLSTPANGATTVAAGTVYFQWSASVDTDYRYYWRDNADGSAFNGPTDLGDQTYEHLYNAAPGHSYSWYVQGCTAPSSCASSATWSFSTVLQPPVAPQTLEPPNGATGVLNPVTLSWEPAGSDNDYRVSYEDQTSPNGWIGNDVGAQTSYMLPTLPGGHRFAWFVYGCTGATSCAANSTASTFSLYSAPGTPQPLSPGNASTNVGVTPTLSWASSSNAIAGATYYQVELWDAQTLTASGPLLVATQPAAQVQVPASQGLVRGRSYWWSLYACTDQLCSSWSDDRLFTTVPPPGIAQEQSPANGATGVGRSVTLTWSAPTANDYAGQTHFYIYLYDTVTNQDLPVYDAGTSLAQAVSGLAGADVYQWQVVSCNGADATQDCASDTWYAFDTGNASSAPSFPGYTTTWYIQSTSLSDADSLGCNAAHLSTVSAANAPRLMILDFGAQTDGSDPSNSSATVHGAEFARHFVGDTRGFIADSYLDTTRQIGGIAEIAQWFVGGYDRCRLPSQTGKTILALGTNNSVMPACNPNPSIGCTYGRVYGTDWADVAGIAGSEIANRFGTSIYAVMGGSDIEQDKGTDTTPGSGGDEANTQTWVNYYYDESGSIPLYNFGTCDECHYASSTGCTFANCQVDGTYLWPNSVDESWDVADVAKLAGASGETLMIPEIYGPIQAQQWGYVLLYANSSFGSSPFAPSQYVYLQGFLTQCLTSGPTATDAPDAAWEQMWAVFNTSSWSYYLGAENPVFSTDIA
jgi:hypothetical protein